MKIPCSTTLTRSIHAASLSRQLLAFSRKQALKPEIVNLNRLLTNLEKMLHRIVGEYIDLVTMLDDDIHRIKADPGQVEQVVINLVVNARDAMPQGGTLTIETSDIEIHETCAIGKQNGVISGRYIMLPVADTKELRSD